jgi:predicted transcriptional regulator YdeE
MDIIAQTNPEPMEQPAIKQKEQLTVVGVGGPFITALAPESNNTEAIPSLWHAFLARQQEIPNRIEGPTYGVCFPPTTEEQANRNECHYVAAAPVSSAGVVPAGMEAHEIPAATYAVFTHRGPVDSIAETMKGIYSEWLPSSQYERAAGADLEAYDNRFTNGDDSELEIWVPVRARE